jgi:hypothetical protein
MSLGLSVALYRFSKDKNAWSDVSPAGEPVFVAGKESRGSGEFGAGFEEAMGDWRARTF